MLKRLTVIIMSLLLGVESTSFASIYDEWLEEESVESTHTSKYSAELDELIGIGAVENLSLSISENAIMSRADFLSLVMNIDSGLSHAEFSGTLPFTDVSEGDSYAWAVSAAYSRGIINGSDDGRFMPDEPVSYYAALKIVEETLNYGSMAEFSGGFPDGYVSVMSDLGLDKMKPENTDALTIGECAKLIVLALEAPALELDVSGKNMSYVGHDDFTWSKKSLSMEKLDGIIDANRYTGLYTANGVGDDSIGIDGDTFSCDGDFSNLIGMRVKYYLKDEETVVYAAPYRNTALEISSENIDKVEDRKVIYFKDNSASVRKNINVPRNIAVIYNNVSYPDYTMETFDIKNGKIEFISNDNSGKYNVAKITDYRPVVASYINRSEESFFDKVSKKTVDYGNIRNWELYTDSGIKTDMSSVEEGSVLNMMISSDGAAASAIVTTRKEIGKVEAFNKASANDYGSVTVNANTLEISPYSANSVNEIALNDSVTLYIDIMGKVVYADGAANSFMRYAYLIKAYIDDDDFNRIQIKLYDSDAKVKSLRTSENFILNGRKVKSYESVPSNIDKASAILYDINDKDEITRIYTPGDSNSPLIEICGFDKRMFYPAGGNYVFAPENSVAYANQFCVDANTLMFKIPSHPNSDSDKNFGILNPSGFSQFEEHRVAAYTTESNPDVAELVIEYNEETSSESISIKNEVMIVADIQTVVNSQKEEVNILTLHGKNARMKEFYTIDADIAAGLTIGDLIVVSLNSHNEIDGIRNVVDFTSAGPVFDAKVQQNSRWYSNCAMFTGSIYSVEKGRIQFARKDWDSDSIDSSSMVSFTNTNLTVVEFDKNAKKKRDIVKAVDSNTIAGYKDTGEISNCLLYVRTGVPMMLVIIK